MSVLKSEFEVLLACLEDGAQTQRDVVAKTNLSLGSVNAVCKELINKNFLDESYAVTNTGLSALEPYRVENAVIMAAGLSSRFAPISYEKPKGLLSVHGETLIERQIRQLHEVGVTDILVVVGYKKEYFFFLEEKYGVRIVVNDEYAARNNHSSLYRVREDLGNTYICSSDVYYTENPFEKYVYQAYYASQYVEGPTEEWCLKTGSGDRITSACIGGSDSWIMIGHAYFDRTFSGQFKSILEADYHKAETIDKLWESLYLDHIKKLTMVIRRYPDSSIHEFDTLDELRSFDPSFIDNVDSEVLENIAKVLQCERKDIHDMYPLKQGITNLSCHFKVDGGEYVYRHPGVGTENLIDRKAEVAAQRVARSLELDGTFIFQDPEKGWKISRFIPNCRPLDPHDGTHLKRAMRMAKKLHSEPVEIDRHFDFYDEGMRYFDLLAEKGPIDVPGFFEMMDKAKKLKAFLSEDNAPTCLTHNDFFMLNFLHDDADNLYLIDWEYAGMSDYAHDYGTFVVCCELSEEEALRALEFYFDRQPTTEEIRHNFAHVALAGWCWYLWSLYKEAEGDAIGEWLYIYYRYGKEYLNKALALYE